MALVAVYLQVAHAHDNQADAKQILISLVVPGCFHPIMYGHTTITWHSSFVKPSIVLIQMSNNTKLEEDACLG